MSEYLKSRDDVALDMLIRRSEAAKILNRQQKETLDSAKRILAERSAAKVTPYFDIHRAIGFLINVAQAGCLCSYKELALACINEPDADWSTYYRKIGGPSGLMQSIIRHCAANDLPQLSSFVVRQNEVKLGPQRPPNREGEAEYGFKRGMVGEGLAYQGTDTDTLVLEHRQACFEWGNCQEKARRAHSGS